MQITGKVRCFGDSWAYGSELNFDLGQRPFVHWFAEILSAEYVNYGKEGSSLGQILNTIIRNLRYIQPQDTVLVIIPPDVRWYSESRITKQFYTITDQDEYDKFLGDKSLDWFTYHHALFVYAIQKILNDVGCKYVMACNYGNIKNIKKYNLAIDYKQFVSDQDLTSILTEQKNLWTVLFHGPDAAAFTGRYFEGCIHHPNELGHKRIAELMLEKYHAKN
jgi:hypothetical protein